MAIGASLVLGLAACANDDGNDGDPAETTVEDTTPAPTAEPDEGDDVEPPPEDVGPEHLEGLHHDAWTRLADAPTSLTEVEAAVFDGEIWVMGGLTARAAVVPTVQIYDPATDSWREGPDLPEPVHHAAVVATDYGLMVLGGYRTIGFDQIADVWVLTDEEAGWAEGPPLPEPRGAGAAAWDGERVLFGGGTTGDDARPLADEVWELARDAEEWQLVGTLSVARDHHAAASDGDGTTWFLGGREGSLATNLATVHVVVGDTVSPLADLPTPRGGVAAFYSPAHGACLVGGEQDDDEFVGARGEVECIDADGRITELPPLDQPRHGLGAEVIDGVAYVVLGGPEIRLAVSGTVEALWVDR
jgi:hypothetical protein